MKLHLDKILKIKTKKDLDEFNQDKPIFFENYLFHYLIILDKLDILKMRKFPVYKLNEEGLDGFMLAAKFDNIPILKYLLKEYPDYAKNHNEENSSFINYLPKPEKLIPLMKQFNKIDWRYLLKFKLGKDIEIYSYLISILDNNNLEWFLKNYGNISVNKYFILSPILKNEKVNDNQKIKLLDTYSEKDLNSKDFENKGLLIDLIDLENVKLTEFLIKKNIDLEYIFKPLSLFITPFFYLYTKLLISHNETLEKIMQVLWKKIKLDYNFISKDGINYVNLVLSANKNDKISIDILKNSPDSCWNRIDLDKKTNLFYLIEKPISKYKDFLKDRELDLTVIDKKGNTVLDYATKEWKNLLTNSKKYKPDLNINLEVNKYQHSTKFSATLADIIIYFIYLDKKYKNLYIPKLFEEKPERKDFPWFINYFEETEVVDIHPRLNYLINNIRREKSYDFGVVFLSLTLDNGNLKHANVLIYDFNKLTLERFEPYGDLGLDEKVDDYLEEELTWNTGFKYLKPKDFLTKPGYQLISNEGPDGMKQGDFGGFCLGWCIWYIEHKLKNPNVEPKILNNKTIEKMLKLDDSFTEFIRNYSNKLFDSKFKIMKSISINEKNISNLYLSKEDEQKIISYAEKYFEFRE